MAAFSGIAQALDATGIIDRTSGYTLAVDSNGWIGVSTLPDITIAPGETIGISGSVEISNDVGNPIPISGSISATPPQLTPLGYQQLTVSNTAVGLTVPVGAEVALIQNETNGTNKVRWRDDGVAPTSAIGMELVPGVQFEYNGDLDAIKFIKQTGVDAKLNISYYSYV